MKRHIKGVGASVDYGPTHHILRSIKHLKSTLGICKPLLWCHLSHAVDFRFLETNSNWKQTTIKFCSTSVQGIHSLSSNSISSLMAYLALEDIASINCNQHSSVQRTITTCSLHLQQLIAWPTINTSNCIVLQKASSLLSTVVTETPA